MQHFHELAPVVEEVLRHALDGRAVPWRGRTIVINGAHDVALDGFFDEIQRPEELPSHLEMQNGHGQRESDENI
jgi:hypothetical protein